MTTETMTIHKALSELKVLNSRIDKAISRCKFCVANKHFNEKIEGIDKKEYIDNMKASYDQVNDLIKRMEAIKKAVVLSNAETKITVAGNTYTVAEAIYMKNNGMIFYMDMLEEMKKQYADAKRKCESENSKLPDRAEQYIISLYGSVEKKDTDVIEDAKKQFIDTQTFEVADPLKINNEIMSLEDKINNFEAEIDAALSVSNATTEITVEY